MTIHKATIITRSRTTTHNINSWCQIVLDLLDLTFAELFKELLETQTPIGLSQLPRTVILIKVTFSLKHRRKISGIFQIFPPSQGTQAKVPKPC